MFRKSSPINLFLNSCWMNRIYSFSANTELHRFFAFINLVTYFWADSPGLWVNQAILAVVTSGMTLGKALWNTCSMSYYDWTEFDVNFMNRSNDVLIRDMSNNLNFQKPLLAALPYCTVNRAICLAAICFSPENRLNFGILYLLGKWYYWS